MTPKALIEEAEARGIRLWKKEPTWGHGFGNQLQPKSSIGSIAQKTGGNATSRAKTDRAQ